MPSKNPKELKHQDSGDEDHLVDAEQLLGDKKKAIHSHPNETATAEKNNYEANADALSRASSTSSLGQDSVGGEGETANHRGGENDGIEQVFKLQSAGGQPISDELARASRLESSIKNQLLHLHDTVNFSRIRSVKQSGSSKRYLHPIEAEAFARFEGSLFELLGLTTEPAFKLPDIAGQSVATKRSHDLKKLKNITSNEHVKSQFLTDMTVLRDNVEMNAFTQLELKKMIEDPEELEADRNLYTGTPEDFKKIELRPKLATIILNQTTRPRKALRLLLTKRNTVSLDAVLNELSYLFKLEAPIRRIYSLTGDQIFEPQELLFNENVFIVTTNEKLLTKDLELDMDEIKLVYANELMKSKSSLNPELLRDKHITLRNESAKKLGHKHSPVTNQLADNDSPRQKSASDMADAPEELLDNYEIGRIIGHGHYAIVRECKDTNTGFKFALKAIDLKKLINKDMVESELKILRRVKHPNIVKLVEEYRSTEFVYLVFEHYKGGDLLELVSKRLKFEEKEVLPMVYSLASALAYLHSLNIVHRDVKLENILIQEYSDGRKSLKLGDFGLATFVTEPLTQKCGSIIYVAPEILDGLEYGLEVDVWSLGIIAYILFCGYAPFQGTNDDESMNAIQQNELKFSKPDWIKVSQLAKELIVRMLDRNQKTRIKAAEILNDKWFADKKPEQETQEKSEAINSAAATFASGNNTENGAKSSAVRFDQRKNSGNANEISEKNELGSTSSAPVKERSLAKFKHTSNYKRSTMLTPRYEEDE